MYRHGMKTKREKGRFSVSCARGGEKRKDTPREAVLPAGGAEEDVQRRLLDGEESLEHHLRESKLRRSTPQYSDKSA